MNPDSFKQGIDYITAITDSQKDKPDYYLTRGFINILARDFSKKARRIVYPNIQMQVGTSKSLSVETITLHRALFTRKEEFQTRNILRNISSCQLKI